MKKSSPSRYWKSQVPVDYLDDSLVQNTWETVVADLSGGKPARILYIFLEQTNNGATAEDLELEITINGIAYTFSQAAAASGSQYQGRISYSASAGNFLAIMGTGGWTVRGFNVNTSVDFIAESVGLIRVRQTSDVDITSAQIEVNIVWDRLEP